MLNLIAIRCLSGIVVSRLEERREVVSYSNQTARTVVSFEPVVEYRYTVEGKDYTSQRISPADKQYARSLAQKALDRYPVGAQVRARYNLRNPTEAFLSVNVG